METFGDRLQYVMRVRKISSTGLANMMERNKSQISRWRSMKTPPDVLYVDEMAEIISCSAYWLETGDGEPFPDLKEKVISLKQQYKYQAHQDIADWIEEQDGIINYWEILKGKLALENPEFREWLKKRVSQSGASTLPIDKSVNSEE